MPDSSNFLTDDSLSPLHFLPRYLRCSCNVWEVNGMMRVGHCGHCGMSSRDMEVVTKEDWEARG